MVKSLVAKLSTASSNLSSTFGVGGSGSGGGTATEETNYAKHRNDPGRFFGDGVQFKAKLIGILEVGEARGDRMCQEALQDLKMAIRAAGEHKQRITIHVTIDGLRLRDEKTGDSLYHHPVHKISFIAQDMTDSRAFGYIFGSPDSGHRFFGIKTDKAASQVVLAMRDLFQVVFELKKKEIEMARQQIQGKSLHDHASQLASLSSLKSAGLGGVGLGLGGHGDLASGVSSGGHALTLLGGSLNSASNGTSRLGVTLDVAKASGSAAKEISPESVADLVDLEQELTSLQRGISQMERITPNDPASSGHPTLAKSASEDDPFGDSFIYVPSYNILPPPPDSGRNRHKPNKTPETAASLDAMLSPAPGASSSQSPAAQVVDNDDDNWLQELEQQNDVFDTTKVGTAAGLGSIMTMAPLASSESTATPTQQLTEMGGSGTLGDLDIGLGSGSVLGQALSSEDQAATVLSLDAFTDLDPLGTGRTRPYVDKKYFFQELKNPPKKLLKELSSGSQAGLGLGQSMGQPDGFFPEDSTTISTTTTTTTATNITAGNSLGAQNSVNSLTTTASTAASLGQLLSSVSVSSAPISFPAPAPTPAPASTSISHAISTSAELKLLLGQVTNPPNPTGHYYTAEPPTLTSLEDPHGHVQAADPVLLPRDTDPFSPTRKKSDPDPFQEGDLFAKLDAFEFEAPPSVPAPSVPTDAKPNVFNGPLQVQLPPEKELELQQPPAAAISSSTVRNRPLAAVSALPSGGPLDVISSISNKKMPHLFGQSRAFGKSSDIGSSVNMRRLQESDSLSETEAAPEPPPRPDSAPYSEPPPLPPKKQFSDLVIRPTPAIPTPQQAAGRYEYLNSSSQVRRTPSSSADAPPIPLPSRRVGRSDGNFPGPGRPRKPGHTEDDYLAPLGGPPPLLPPPSQGSSVRSRPQRQASLGRPQDIYENKAEILQAQAQAQVQGQVLESSAPLAPDITLTQLLTLGMDELAVKLNVPASKLSTMTLVQLTAYLSEYLSSEKSQVSSQPERRSSPANPPPPAAPPSTAAVFKVNFDQQTSFVAKFDDTFGEDEVLPASSSDSTFVANFANFNDAPVPTPMPGAGALSAPIVPPADRYAVFREIIDQELQQQQQETDLMGDLTPPPVDESLIKEAPECLEVTSVAPELPIDALEVAPAPKIDTKITEVVAQAKDRYAALRDIILVENLFDKPSPPVASAQPEKDLLQDFPEFSDEFNEDHDLRQIMDHQDHGHSQVRDRRGLVDSRGFPAEPSSSALTVDDDDEDEDADAAGESSLDSNEKDAEPVSGQDQYEKLSTSTQQLDTAAPVLEDLPQPPPQPQSLTPKQDQKFLSVLTGPPGAGTKDDIEIDELMHRAISNLSLDSRERVSPATSSAAPSRGAPGLHTPSQFNDVSTSPIPLQKPVLGGGPSPVPSQLSAVSQLIDTATKQIGDRDREKQSAQSWATFDSPKNKGKARLTLPPPPPPASNTSQPDTVESPCSSDPRDDGWSKQQRRWAKKERQQTSSSSRDLSPWDDETPEYLKRRQLAAAQMAHPHQPPMQPPPDRHGYYMRHARRMNSCDEDYDYDAEFMARRDQQQQQQQRKFKHGLSRSRDNFDLDSPSWYHHPAHHTWSPQEIEQARARSFERASYERSSYGPPPPIYDKRGQLRSKYRSDHRDRDRERERERDRDREYRDYARPSYDFDYENVYEERGGRSPMAYKPGRGGADYMYDRERDRDRDRKSFDRESLESYESANRRRRSFGSGNDVYGSLDSREDYRGERDRDRERDREQMKTRSLRKPTTTSGKLRISGDIDYEQDSEQDFQQRPGVRSLQRPSQLGGDVVLPSSAAGGSQRLRKSSGSSPWDGEEPTLPGQKSWKRPASAAETERRLAESRRAAALGQTPSDGEKERRFRKKTRARSAKDLANMGTNPGSAVPPSRYGRPGMRDNYDYMGPPGQRNDEVDDEDDDDDEDYVDDEPPTDEDKFERLNRRRHEMHQRMMESERRHMERHQPPPALGKLPGQNRNRGGVGVVNSDYGFVDSYEQTPTPTPRSNASSTGPGGMMMSGGESSAGVTSSKFNFDDGFESDFNQSSPPPAPAGTASSCTSTPAGQVSGSGNNGGSKSLFRFSNDFSDREKREQFEADTPPTSTPPITQKLRFDDNVKVSQFDDAAFEDDFAKASFDFEKEQVTAGGAGGAMSRKQNMRTSKLQQRQELIKKSESVNIFAKKQEDPFEDDEFFRSPDQEQSKEHLEELPESGGGGGGKFQWGEEANFAKFDENM
ncbi:protein disabled isoform X1 [Drosophila bipectinata]|uniref:protein disabled isoform X1 n=1 Tax=Drosophila bipectinata TaxID=42026 RepID=UPI0038B3D7BC